MKIRLVKMERDVCKTFSIMEQGTTPEEEKFIRELHNSFTESSNGITLLAHLVVSADTYSISTDIHTDMFEQLPNSNVFVPRIYLRKLNG